MIQSENSQKANGPEIDHSSPVKFPFIKQWEDLTLLRNLVIPAPDTWLFCWVHFWKQGPNNLHYQRIFQSDSSLSIWQQCCDNTSGADSTLLCKPPTKPFFEYIKGCLSTKPTHANLKMQGNIWLRRAFGHPFVPTHYSKQSLWSSLHKKLLCISSIQEM